MKCKKKILEKNSVLNHGMRCNVFLKENEGL